MRCPPRGWPISPVHTTPACWPKPFVLLRVSGSFAAHQGYCQRRRRAIAIRFLPHWMCRACSIAPPPNTPAFRLCSTSLLFLHTVSLLVWLCVFGFLCGSMAKSSPCAYFLTVQKFFVHLPNAFFFWRIGFTDCLHFFNLSVLDADLRFVYQPL